MSPLALFGVSLVRKPSQNTGTTKGEPGTNGTNGAIPEVHRLSQQAHERLQTELTELTGRGRIEIAQRIEKARLLGDLKENGDYHAAKEEQGKMEGRIRQLESLLNKAEIWDESEHESNPQTVTIGVVVELLFRGDKDNVKFLFGSTEERHEDGLDVVSVGSPMGQALEGAAVGATVSYQAGGSELSVKVISLSR